VENDIKVSEACLFSIAWSCIKTWQEETKENGRPQLSYLAKGTAVSILACRSDLASRCFLFHCPSEDIVVENPIWQVLNKYEKLNSGISIHEIY
jgi:hypothetical protein